MKTILVGIDFTKSSENTIKYAIALAEKSHSKILLFHALTAPIIHSNSGLFFITANDFIKVTEKKMKGLQSRLSSENPAILFDIEITYNGVREKVETLSLKNKISLVVLGLETKSKISKFMNGTTSVDLAGKINCPIITVPEKYKHHQFKKILIAIDNMESISSSLSKRIHLNIDFLGLKPEFVHIKTDDELNIINETNKQFKMTTVDAPNFKDGISKYAKKTNTDLIMLISHHYSAFHSLFIDNHSKKIILSSNIPVISIPK